MNVGRYFVDNNKFSQENKNKTGNIKQKWMQGETIAFLAVGDDAVDTNDHVCDQGTEEWKRWEMTERRPSALMSTIL